MLCLAMAIETVLPCKGAAAMGAEQFELGVVDFEAMTGPVRETFDGFITVKARERREALRLI